MNEELKKYLIDIQKALDEIESFVGPKKDFIEYQRSAMLRAAVERKIEIVGEAMNQMLKLDEEVPITNAREIVNTRNKIIHGYDEVDDLLIWEIVVIHLPVLAREIKALLDEDPEH